jgi:hypothetical protein
VGRSRARDGCAPRAGGFGRGSRPAAWRDAAEGAAGAVGRRPLSVTSASAPVAFPVPQIARCGFGWDGSGSGRALLPVRFESGSCSVRPGEHCCGAETVPFPWHEAWARSPPIQGSGRHCSCHGRSSSCGTGTAEYVPFPREALFITINKGS